VAHNVSSRDFFPTTPSPFPFFFIFFLGILGQRRRVRSGLSWSNTVRPPVIGTGPDYEGDLQYHASHYNKIMVWQSHTIIWIIPHLNGCNTEGISRYSYYCKSLSNRARARLDFYRQKNNKTDNRPRLDRRVTYNTISVPIIWGGTQITTKAVIYNENRNLSPPTL